ncbi:MAG TPA: adenylosuccinate lyase [Candidatus Thermoplasmatota archaeon]|nr:adenylosuccinate lyase [Candidatus Thermoplasmatota archaeon]
MSLLACPIDFRYGREAMRRIFSEEGRLARFLAVEAALAAAHASVGNVPPDAAREIARKATTQHVTVARVKEIEATIRHDLMAVVRALTERCEGGAGAYVHLGATSYDIIDTATALQVAAALDFLEDALRDLLRELSRLAREHRDTPCVGRTHGQHAVPMTFGLKMAVFALETQRHLVRLREARPRVVVGKMSGAVGTGAGLGPKALAIEAEVGRALGIAMEEGPTQIVQRDRLAELLGHLANLAASLEKFSTEVRNLQRTEIGEVHEGFDVERQVGSSTMAQKRNPVRAENVSSLARLVRSFTFPAYENAVQWHERDLANSANERFLIPHALILADHAVVTCAELFRDLHVDRERMLANLRATPTILSEAVMVALVEKGMGRQDAHEAVRRAALSGGDFRSALLADKAIADRMPARDLDALLAPEKHVGHSGAIVDRALARLAQDLGKGP